MKKLLHVINVRRFGGVEMLFKNYLERQENDDSVEHHILLDRDMIHPHIGPVLKRVAKSINVVKPWVNWKLPFIYSMRSCYLVKKINPDRVVMWNCYKPVLPAIEALSNKIDFVYYDHGAILLSSSHNIFVKIVSKFAFSVVCGRAIQRVFQLKCPNVTALCKVVDNGIDFDATIPSAKQLQNNQEIVLGIAAHLRPIKGHALLFHSVAQLKRQGLGVILLIAGTGPEESRLKALATRLDINDCVRFLGFVQNMTEYYQKIDIAILPSFSETFGLAAVEAMAAGCVTIVPSVNNFLNIIQDGVNGFCIVPRLSLSELAQYDQSTTPLPTEVYDPLLDQLQPPKGLHPDDITRTIESLLSSPEIFTRISQEAILYSRRQFNFSDYVTNLNQVLLAGVD